MSKIQNMWQKVVNKLTDEEILVANATSTKVYWGPTTEEMDQIIQASRGPAQQKILQFIFTQLVDQHVDWRVIYKTLLLIEYMALHADMYAVDYFKRNISDVRRLQSYQFRDKEGADKGINVRKRAEAVADSLEDTDLPQKRKEAQEQKVKYTYAVGSGFSGSYGGATSGSGSYGGSGSYNSNAYYQPTQSNEFQNDEPQNLGGFAQVNPGAQQYQQQQQQPQPQYQQQQPQPQYQQQQPQPQYQQYQQYYQPQAYPQPQQQPQYPQPQYYQAATVAQFQAPPQPQPQYQQQQQQVQKPVSSFAPPPPQQQYFQQPQPQFQAVQKAPQQQPDLLNDIFGAPQQPRQPAFYAQPAYQAQPAYYPQTTYQAQPQFNPMAAQPQFAPQQQFMQPYAQPQATYQPAAQAPGKKKDNLASLLDF